MMIILWYFIDSSLFLSVESALSGFWVVANSGFFVVSYFVQV